MSTSSSDISASMNNILLAPSPSTVYVESLEREVAYLKTQLNERTAWPHVQQAFFERLYQDVLNTNLPEACDPDALYGRLLHLVKTHEDMTSDTWSPQQEFNVEITYRVTVCGTLEAKTKADAKRLAAMQEITFQIDDSEDLLECDIHDVAFESASAY